MLCLGKQSAGVPAASAPGCISCIVLLLVQEGANAKAGGGSPGTGTITVTDNITINHTVITVVFVIICFL